MAKKAAKSGTKAKAAAPKAMRLSPSAKPRKKSELYNIIADHVGIARKQVAGVFEALGKVMATDLAKPSESRPKIFVVPGMLKVTAQFKPAQPARKGKNPFTGEEIMLKPKPASTKLKIRALKQLKAMV